MMKGLSKWTLEQGLACWDEGDQQIGMVTGGISLYVPVCLKLLELKEENPLP